MNEHPLKRVLSDLDLGAILGWVYQILDLEKKVLAYDTYHLHVDLDKGALYIESEFSTSLNLLDVFEQVLHASGDHTALLIG